MFRQARSFGDERGSMTFDFDSAPFAVVQSISTANNKNVLRGMHCSPYHKMVCCRSGRFTDVIVSPEGVVSTFDMVPGSSLVIEPHFAHGYFCHEASEIHYFLGGSFVPELEKYYNWNDPFLNIPWKFPKGAKPIINDRDMQAPLFKPVHVVILGAGGYLGANLLRHIPGSVAVDIRLENTSELQERLAFLKPQHVVSAAGISGKPTTAWCEAHRYNCKCCSSLASSRPYGRAFPAAAVEPTLNPEGRALNPTSIPTATIPGDSLHPGFE